MERPDPPLAADERTTLLAFLDHQRATLLMKTAGLGHEQLNRPLPTSKLTLAGLLKHVAMVEDAWVQSRFCGRPDLEPWASAPWEQDDDWDFHSATQDEPDTLRDLYRQACQRTRDAVSDFDLDDVSAEQDPTGQQWTLRWVITHLIEETARHNGHADLLREAIDGAVGH